MLETLTRVHDQVGGCVDTPAWALPDSTLVECLDVVHTIEARLSAIKAHLVREIDARDMPATRPSTTSTAAWLRDRLRISAHAAERLIDLADALDTCPALDRAVGAGAVNAEQATAIAAATDEIANGVAANTAAEAQATLIDFASTCEPARLRTLGTWFLGRMGSAVAPNADRINSTDRINSADQASVPACTATEDPGSSPSG